MCPACNSKDLRVSHKRWTDVFALLLRARPVRCRHCDCRSYEWPWTRDWFGRKLARR